MNPVFSLAASVLPAALVVAVTSSALAAIGLGLWVLATGRTPQERTTFGVIGAGLLASLTASIVVAVGAVGAVGVREVDFGPWIRIVGYEVPLVFLVDKVAVAFALLASGLTALVARFSFTYLHKERGFLRFYVLLGLFGAGTQLISYAGGLDLMFLGWELVGLSSALFIGFFHDRVEPVRSSLRAFVTYRVCDAGFLFGIVATHELIGSTRLSALHASTLSTTLTPTAATGLALLFLLAAFGKSAQLPFSGWLPRAMEGPTPSSALFYGGVSVHAGLFLLLRVWPVLDLAPVAEVTGVVVGLATAIYATLVARTCTDAKGTLAHATLAQVGLILGEISLGWTTLALAHLVGHALLRVWQYLRAPNVIHDAHRTDVAAHAVPSSLAAMPRPAPTLSSRWFALALFRMRIDERLDLVVDAVVVVARVAAAAIEEVFGERRRSRPHEVAVIVAAVVVGSCAAVASLAADAAVFGAASGGVFVVAAFVAFVAGLSSVAQRELRGLFRSKVLVHAGFVVCAVASGHAGAIVFAAGTAAVALGGFGFVVAAVERRAGRVSLLQPGARITAFPHLAAAFAVIGAAGVGLPATAGFVADDLLLHAAWQQGVVVTGFLIAAAVFLAIGTLRAWQRVFLGPPDRARGRSIAPDLTVVERVVVVAVIVALLVFGLVPGVVLAWCP